jgi:hypothetical protein
MRNNVDGTYQMKLGTVPAMIARLTHRVFYSPTDVRAFLLQYEKFTTPTEILKCLKQGFFPRDFKKATDLSNPADRNLIGVRRSVLCFLESWLSLNDNNPECFDPEMVEDGEEGDDARETLDYMTTFVEEIMDTFVIVDINDELEKVTLPLFGEFVRDMHEELFNGRWREQQAELFPEESQGGGRTSVSTTSTAMSTFSNFGNKDFGHYTDVLDIFDLRRSSSIVNSSDRDGVRKPDNAKAKAMLGRMDTFTNAPPALKTKISQFSSEDLAQQLTLLNHTLFCQIPVEEFVGTRYRNIDTGPNFQHMKAMSNKLSFFLISAILHEEDVTARAHVIKLLIQTAENCLGLENFDMFVSIISVLGSSAIHRLKQVSDKRKAVVAREINLSNSSLARRRGPSWSGCFRASGRRSKRRAAEPGGTWRRR